MGTGPTTVDKSDSPPASRSCEPGGGAHARTLAVTGSVRNAVTGTGRVSCMHSQEAPAGRLDSHSRPVSLARVVDFFGVGCREPARPAHPLAHPEQ